MLLKLRLYGNLSGYDDNITRLAGQKGSTEIVY